MIAALLRAIPRIPAALWFVLRWLWCAVVVGHRWAVKNNKTTARGSWDVTWWFSGYCERCGVFSRRKSLYEHVPLEMRK